MAFALSHALNFNNVANLGFRFAPPQAVCHRHAPRAAIAFHGSWGSASLHPRLYAIATLRGLRLHSTDPGVPLRSTPGCMPSPRSAGCDWISQIPRVPLAKPAVSNEFYFLLNISRLPAQHVE